MFGYDEKSERYLVILEKPEDVSEMFDSLPYELGNDVYFIDRLRNFAMNEEIALNDRSVIDGVESLLKNSDIFLGGYTVQNKAVLFTQKVTKNFRYYYRVASELSSKVEYLLGVAPMPVYLNRLDYKYLQEHGDMLCGRKASDEQEYLFTSLRADCENISILKSLRDTIEKNGEFTVVYGKRAIMLDQDYLDEVERLSTELQYYRHNLFYLMGVLPTP